MKVLMSESKVTECGVLGGPVGASRPGKTPPATGLGLTWVRGRLLRGVFKESSLAGGRRTHCLPIGHQVLRARRLMSMISCYSHKSY